MGIKTPIQQNDVDVLQSFVQDNITLREQVDELQSKILSYNSKLEVFNRVKSEDDREILGLKSSLNELRQNNSNLEEKLKNTQNQLENRENELKNQINEISAQKNQEISEQKINFSEKIENLKSENSRILLEISAISSKLEISEKNLQKFKLKSENLENQLNQNSDERAENLQKQVENFNEKNEDLDKNLKETQQKLEISEQNLKNRDEMIEKLKIELENSKKDFENLKKNFDEISEKNAEFLATISLLQQKLETSKNESETLKSSQNEQISSLKSEFDAKILEKDENSEKIQENLKNLESEKTEILTEKSKIEEELEKVKNELENTKKSLSEHQNLQQEFDAVSSEKTSLLTEKESLLASLATAQQKIKDGEQIDQIRTALTSTQSTLQNREMEVISLKTQLANAVDPVIFDRIKSKLKESEKQNDSLTANLKDFESQNSEMKLQIESLKSLTFLEEFLIGTAFTLQTEAPSQSIVIAGSSMICFLTIGKTTCLLETYDVITQLRTPVRLTDPSIFLKLKEFSVCCNDDSLFISGGKIDKTVSRKVHSINIHSGLVEMLKDGPAVYAHASAVKGNTLIISGGKISNDEYNSAIYALDLTMNQWDIRKQHIMERRDCFIDENELEEVVIVGGKHSSKEMISLQLHNTMTATDLNCSVAGPVFVSGSQIVVLSSTHICVTDAKTNKSRDYQLKISLNGKSAMIPRGFIEFGGSLFGVYQYSDKLCLAVCPSKDPAKLASTLQALV